MLDYKKVQLLEHPIRFHIWKAHEADPDRPLVPQKLCRDISATEDLRPSVSQVDYHLRLLQHAGLIPER